MLKSVHVRGYMMGQVLVAVGTFFVAVMGALDRVEFVQTRKACAVHPLVA